MTDRTPTQILANGAIRYAEYDEDGNFIQYRYLVLDDAPTDPGTALSKANLFGDTTSAKYPSGTETVDDVFGVLANAIVTQDGLKTVLGDDVEVPTSQLTGTIPYTSITGKIAYSHGTYTGEGGTGTVTLTFDFMPFLVILTPEYDADSSAKLIAIRSASDVVTYSAIQSASTTTMINYGVDLTWGDTTLSFARSSTSAPAQAYFRNIGDKYNYLAIGITQ